MKKILIMAGGTGGHIFPALTIADQCYVQGVAVFWLGSKGGMEESLVKPHYHLHTIHITGVRGNGKLRLLLAPFALLRSVLVCIKILRKISPDVVLGMGGFASGPGGIAASILKIPLVIHEQNAIPGMTNKWLSYIASDVLQAFCGSFPSKRNAKLVGNPVRSDILSLPGPGDRYSHRDGACRILVIGGSRGAHVINKLMLGVVASWSLDVSPIIWHQTGENDFVEVSNKYDEISPASTVESFISNMALAYEWADIVVARAGALTIFELSAVGVASILIPYPYAVDDHQTLNAKSLEDAGGAIVLQQQALTVDILKKHLQDLCGNREKMITMATHAESIGDMSSRGKIIVACENAAKGRKGKGDVVVG